ncbi:MAG: aryl-sulfate sulfotransferase [Proteobacteria bacterium]|nr:aryl-sulfate sulfotransferase [Pseudomonadota bacterium]
MRPLQYGVTCYERELIQPGYVLFAPAGGSEVFLIGERGDVAHQWRLPGKLGNYGQLLENGNLLVTTKAGGGPKLAAGGGRILELDPHGEIVWEHTDLFQHHDLNPTPNGNVLYLAWELVTSAETRVKGGIPGSDHRDGGVYEDLLREVDRDGKIVWEWKLKDHFPYDKYPLRATTNRHEFAHGNACHVQADGNVLVSFRQIDLAILVNRQTGEIDWEMQDRGWGGQHDCQRLDNGNIILFANGSEQPSPEHSRILEIDPASKEVVWQYKGKPAITFFSPRVSGVHRMPNGNTVICEGMHGRIFEVTQAGDIVWEYISPFYNAVPMIGTTNQMFRARKYTKGDPRLNRLLEN